MMFYEPPRIELPGDTPPSGKLITYCQSVYQRDFDRVKNLRKYFLTQNPEIMSRIMSDPDMPNNQVAHAFARYIAKIATAYFMGKGLRYETEDAAFLEALREVLRDSHAAAKNYEAAKEMSISGVSYELQYLDNEGNYQTALFKGDQVILVFSGDLGHFLSLAIRFYAVNRLDGSHDDFAEMYTNQEIITYRHISTRWLEESRHSHMGTVPILLKRNNEERKGDFEDVLPLINAYDSAQSDSLNDFDYFTEAYMKITGVEEIVKEEVRRDASGAVVIDQKTQKCMKENRTLYFPDGGDASFLVKEINDTATENFKNRIYRDIFFLSQVPNLTDESFAGNLSGIAMKYKLYGLSELSEEKEKYWISAEQKKIRMITEYLNLKYRTHYDWKTVTVTFDRTAFNNTLEIAQEMTYLRDILSKKTVIGLYPGIDNPEEELRALQEERSAEEILDSKGIYE